MIVKCLYDGGRPDIYRQGKIYKIVAGILTLENKDTLGGFYDLSDLHTGTSARWEILSEEGEDDNEHYLPLHALLDHLGVASKESFNLDTSDDSTIFRFDGGVLYVSLSEQSDIWTHASVITLGNILTGESKIVKISQAPQNTWIGWNCSDCGERAMYYENNSTPSYTKYCPHCGLEKTNYKEDE